MSILVLTDSGQRVIEPRGEADTAQLLINNGIYIRRQCGGRGTCGKCTVLCDSKRVLACKHPVSDNMTIDCRGSARYEILKETCLAPTPLLPVSGDKSCFCAAVDIGTTTVAVKLYRMPEFEPVDEACELNAQSSYGADVISRMEFANGGGLGELTRLIRSQVSRMLGSFGVEIEKAVITGNTAMLHFYQGLKTDAMAVAPFEPSSLFGYECNIERSRTLTAPDFIYSCDKTYNGCKIERSKTLTAPDFIYSCDKTYNGIKNVIFPRCVSAFVGADITCAVLSSGLVDDSCALLADLGTNGEIAYIKDGRLQCCSVAAGPAFEGAGISQGVTACEGAIDKVYIANSSLFYTTIGGSPPIGICASGLIDAVACMLELGELDETGYLERPYPIGDSGVFLTDKDIRAVQLAKSAVRTGIDMLAGDCSGISVLYLAGGFGSSINAKSCERIGLIPRGAAGKIKCVSNAALAGAAMMIKNRTLVGKSAEIAAAAETVVLSGNPLFSEKYVENMLFIS